MKSINFKKLSFSLLGLGIVSFFVWFFMKTNYENLIIISKAKISDYQTWHDENKDYIYTGQYEQPTKCNDPIAINLDKISLTDGNKVRDWLKNNSKYICFEDSYKYIESAHIITDSNSISVINNATNKRPLSFKDISDKSTNLMRVVNSNLNFENHGYEGYLNFFNFLGDTRFLYDYGIIGEGRYSIPFFRSIRASVNKEFGSTDFPEKDIIFSFVQVNLNGRKVIAFTVEATNGSKKFKQYYNFSTDPGKPISYKLL